MYVSKTFNIFKVLLLRKTFKVLKS